MILPWIDDDNLTGAIDQLISSAGDTVREASVRQQKNVIDPFFSLLIAASHDVQAPEHLKSMRNAEASVRGMGNFLGKFHETILGSAHGWTHHDAGYDIESQTKKIIAEVKNKYNTLNGPNRRQVLQELETNIRSKGPEWTAYLVEIIPSSPRRYTKFPTTRDNVVATDGASFYHIATGQLNALHDLFDVVAKRIGTSPSIVEHCQQIFAASIPPRKPEDDATDQAT